MKTLRTKLKIISIGQVQTSITPKTTTRKVIVSVVELPDNPFGHSDKAGNQFDVEVYNHNIESWNIDLHQVNAIVDAELLINFYKRDNSSPAIPKFIVNQLSFSI